MIKITTDKTCEMIKIEKDGETLFYGNEWDFDRSADNFKKLFNNIGLETKIVEKKYEEW